MKKYFILRLSVVYYRYLKCKQYLGKNLICGGKRKWWDISSSINFAGLVAGFSFKSQQPKKANIRRTLGTVEDRDNSPRPENLLASIPANLIGMFGNFDFMKVIARKVLNYHKLLYFKICYKTAIIKKLQPFFYL